MANPTTTPANLSPALRWTTNAVSLLSVLLFSGIIFGWAPLEMLLLEEGQYGELCDPDDDVDGAGGPCAEQTDRLHAMFTAAQFALSFASLPVGFALDASSKAAHFAAAGVVEITGLTLMATSESSGTDLFGLAYTLLAVGGCMTMLGAFPASFLVVEHQAAILAIVSCLFDGSSAVFFAFYGLHRSGYARRTIFGCWAAIAAVVYAALVACWTVLERRDWRAIVEREEKEEEEESAALLAGGDGDDESEPPFAAVEGAAERRGDEDAPPCVRDRYVARVRAIGMHSLGVARQLRTREYSLALLFASCQMVRCNFYIMVVDDFLAGIGDDDRRYANLFSFMLPCGIVFVPLIEWTITKWGVLQVLHLTNAIGLVFGLLLLVPSLPLQSLNFGIFTCFRAYLYAILNTFIAVTFGVRTMGRIIGFVFTTAAVVTLVQYPLSVWTNFEQGGDYLPANAVVLFLGTLPVAATLLYGRSVAATPIAPPNATRETYGSILLSQKSHEQRTSLLESQASIVMSSPGSPSLRSLRRER